MKLNCRAVRMLLIAGTALVYASSLQAQGQAESLVARPSLSLTAKPATQVATGDNGQPADLVRHRLLLLRYSFFIEFAGREDLMVKRKHRPAMKAAATELLTA
jgi:hypothetical protein